MENENAYRLMTPEEAITALSYPVRKWSTEWDEREDGLDYTEAIDLAIAALRDKVAAQNPEAWHDSWHQAYTDLLTSLTSVLFGRQMYFEEPDGTWYSRFSGKRITTEQMEAELITELQRQ